MIVLPFHSPDCIFTLEEAPIPPLPIGWHVNITPWWPYEGYSGSFWGNWNTSAIGLMEPLGLHWVTSPASKDWGWLAHSHKSYSRVPCHTLSQLHLRFCSGLTWSYHRLTQFWKKKSQSSEVHAVHAVHDLEIHSILKSSDLIHRPMIFQGPILQPSSSHRATRLRAPAWSWFSAVPFAPASPKPLQLGRQCLGGKQGRDG